MNTESSGSLKAESITAKFPPTPASSLKRSWPGILFLLTILITAGITASIVGYKVKQGEVTRKELLLSAYTRLGGHMEQLSNPTQRISTETMSPEKRAFVTTYQLNERVRAYGLVPTLEHTPSDQIPDILQALQTIGATEAFNATKDTWETMTAGAVLKGDEILGRSTSAEAARLAQRYDRYIIRDTATHIFKYAAAHHIVEMK